MDAVLNLQNYDFGWAGVPFFVAAFALTALCLYVLFVMGNPLLRAAFVMFCASLIPYTLSYAFASATTDPDLAVMLYKLGLTPLSFAPASIFLYEVALARRVAKHRGWVVLAFAIAAANAVVMASTDLFVADAAWTEWGPLHYRATPLGLVFSGSLALWMFATIAFVWRRVRAERLDKRRRQLRGSMLAFAVCALALVDIPLAYGHDWYPTSWLWFTLGVVALFRSLVKDDLIIAKSLDPRTPARLLYGVAAGAGLWGAWLLAHDSPALLAACLLGVYAVLRMIWGLSRTVRNRSTTFGDTPLKRVLEQYARRVPDLRSNTEIGQLTVETTQLGLGCDDVHVLLPSQDDWSWIRLDGATLPEQAMPDPLALNWFYDHADPILRDELDTIRISSVRSAVERLFHVHGADVLIPLVNRDEVVGMVLCGAVGDRTWHREDIEFLTRLQEHATAALLYARMYRLATERVELDRQLELAAAVQSGFVPRGELVDCGSVVLSGVYRPASQCGGDWWSVQKLPDGRVLVLIGDVTGHGVAAAMVTAAAKGCYDVVARLMADEFDLVRLLELLDASVRRVGASQFHMTCFATLLDPERGEVEFANAGHVVPYLCRITDNGVVKLGALVARGNPLGAGDRVSSYAARRRELRSGDVLIWYTDGIVECMDREREPFGDRRMQRILRKLGELEPDEWPALEGSSPGLPAAQDLARRDPSRRSLLVRTVCEQIVTAVYAHQGGEEPEDDITLVAAQVA